MKPLRLLVLLVSLPLLLGGCGEKDEVTDETKPKLKSVNYGELEQRESIWYLKGSETPYSGKAFRWGGEYQRHWQWNLRDGKKDGLHVWWHENGKKSSEGNWKNGERDGPFVAWHDNGQKRSEGNWKDGKVIGLSFGWHANGQKMYEGTNNNGEKFISEWTGCAISRGGSRSCLY